MQHKLRKFIGPDGYILYLAWPQFHTHFELGLLVCDFTSREVISSVYWGQLIAEVFGRGC